MTCAHACTMHYTRYNWFNTTHANETWPPTIGNNVWNCGMRLIRTLTVTLGFCKRWACVWHPRPIDCNQGHAPWTDTVVFYACDQPRIVVWHKCKCPATWLDLTSYWWVRHHFLWLNDVSFDSKTSINIRCFFLFPKVASSILLPRVMLCEDNFWQGNTFAQQLNQAYDDFRSFLRSRKIACSQKRFTPRLVTGFD